eukprot:4043702-Alexandrium_andersonii.AAC.1
MNAALWVLTGAIASALNPAGPLPARVLGVFRAARGSRSPPHAGVAVFAKGRLQLGCKVSRRDAASLVSFGTAGGDA